jgi:hypothetical protein
MIGQNVVKRPDLFQQKVAMWVHEEVVRARKLSELINEVSSNG